MAVLIDITYAFGTYRIAAVQEMHFGRGFVVDFRSEFFNATSRAASGSFLMTATCDSSSTNGESSEVIIQLLDASFHIPVKTWRFAGKSEITIGRGDERDVEISDVYVSRHHASIVRRDDTWVLVSLGRHGVLVQNHLVTETPLGDETQFCLGPSGPSLFFRTSNVDDLCQSTKSFPPPVTPMFRLDEKQVSKEVSAIVEGDYFQNLQKKAKHLRQMRDKS